MEIFLPHEIFSILLYFFIHVLYFHLFTFSKSELSKSADVISFVKKGEGNKHIEISSIHAY